MIGTVPRLELDGSSSSRRMRPLGVVASSSCQRAEVKFITAHSDD